jgi:hypothetical protein
VRECDQGRFVLSVLIEGRRLKSQKNKKSNTRLFLAARFAVAPLMLACWIYFLVIGTQSAQTFLAALAE